MLKLDADRVFNPEVAQLVDEYVCLLDRRAGMAWLDLFTPDGYYLVAREVELEQGNNVLILGEDMKRLRARVVPGLERDRRRAVHSVSGVRTNDGASHATASFTVWLDGKPAYCGVYRMALARIDARLRIQRCEVVLFGDVVHTPIFLPI